MCSLNNPQGIMFVSSAPFGSIFSSRNFPFRQQVPTARDSTLNPEAVLQKLPTILSDKSCNWWPSVSCTLGLKTPSLRSEKEPRTGQALGTKLKPLDESTFIQLTVYWRTETNKLRIEQRKESTVCLLRGSLSKDTSLSFKQLSHKNGKSWTGLLRF